MPIKVNMSGVLPVIFASSILSLPGTVQMFLSADKYEGTFWEKFFKAFQGDSWWYAAMYFLLIIFFAYFYTSITFNPLEIADNMKKQGGFIPGIRPGRPTSDYLTKILNYIIFVGAIGLIIVCVVPIFFNGVFGANVSFGGTSIIIIVGVILETVKQIESQMLVRNYKGFLNN